MTVEKAMVPHSSTPAWKSHGWRSLVGCSPCCCYEADTTERLHFHFSLSCIGEGNGNPLQCSCLENPRDGGAWWVVIYGVTQSQTWLKWLSSSSRLWQRAKELSQNRKKKKRWQIMWLLLTSEDNLFLIFKCIFKVIAYQGLGLLHVLQCRHHVQSNRCNFIFWLL